MSSIYIHIPFCSRKCPYCDFFSQPGTNADIAAYGSLLEKNIHLLARDTAVDSPLTTIFFGGGTPSLLEPSQIQVILQHLDNAFNIADHAEITLEANPGTVSLEKLQGYRAAGLNRLSLGIQSLTDRNLRILGRIHDRKTAIASVKDARKAGFDNISLDLIFALPEQSLEQNAAEVEQLLELNPEHIALYGLSFEEGTPFGQKAETGQLSPCSEELYAAQYRQIHELVSDAGFEHYEISNFARPGHRCQHNQVYWKRDTCLAIGCGAHGFDQRSWGRRWLIPADIPQVTKMLQNNKNPAETIETFDCESAMSEYCYLRLRTSDGLDLAEFQTRFNHSAEQVFRTALARCQNHLIRANNTLTFDLDGWLIYDHLISEFL